MSSVFDSTPLELIADGAGVGPDELREHLRAEIERRRAAESADREAAGPRGVA